MLAVIKPKSQMKWMKLIANETEICISWTLNMIIARAGNCYAVESISKHLHTVSQWVFKSKNRQKVHEKSVKLEDCFYAFHVCELLQYGFKI